MNCASKKNAKKSSKKNTQSRKATTVPQPRGESEEKSEDRQDIGQAVGGIDETEKMAHIPGTDTHSGDVPGVNVAEIGDVVGVKVEEIGESTDDHVADEDDEAELTIEPNEKFDEHVKFEEAMLHVESIEKEAFGPEDQESEDVIKAGDGIEGSKIMSEGDRDIDVEEGSIISGDDESVTVSDMEKSKLSSKDEKAMLSLDSEDIEFGLGDDVVFETDEKNDHDGKGVQSVKFGIEVDRDAVDEGEGCDPFSEFVDRMSVEDVLRTIGNDGDEEENDMNPGVDLVVQYLRKRDKKQLKATLRSMYWHVKHDIRDCLWYKICHHLHKADDQDMLAEFSEDLFPNDGSTADIRIPTFVDMNHLHSYHLNDQGVEAAKKILCVLSHSCPDVIHSPMIFSLLALFLHYMDASQCYNCIYALLRQSNCSFLTTTRVSHEASKLVIRDLAKKYAKSSYANLVRASTNIDQVFDSWLWWILEDLPLHFLVPIIDCFLHEGFKVFYRIALAILIQFQKANSKKSAMSPKKETYSVANVRQFCREMPISVTKLIKTGFSVRGLNRKEIRKLQVKHEMYVTSTKHLSNYADNGNTIPLSRSFSGPIILQNASSNTLTPDMPARGDKVRTRSVGTLQFTPKVDRSNILDRHDLYAIWTWLPTRYAVCQPELLYTSEEHGISLVTLYQRVENYQPTIIVIKTTHDEVFGAFCSMYWRERRQKSQKLSYFGTGETFIFTLAPEKKKYGWVGLTEEKIPNTANMFQAGDRSILTIGGGHGEAIRLDENMNHCRSVRCDTFNNQPLSANEDFNCKVVEVYGFQQ